MLNKNDLGTIKKEIEEFFEKMEFEVEIEFLPETDGTLPVNLKSQEPQILIGENGQTLSEIQHLLKIILKKKIKDLFFIDIDISDYKKKKKEYLREMAKSIADEVSLSKIEKSLPSMSAYERRVVHMALAERKDIITESMGSEPDRKIIIKPNNFSENNLAD
jgi:spoIIIJ-associated protein